MVGKLQPILARLPQTIASRVLAGHRGDFGGATVVEEVQNEFEHAEQVGFDIDAVTEADLEEPYRPEPLLNMDDLDRVLRFPQVMPPGIRTGEMTHREYRYSAPGMAEELRVTTDPDYYEEHADSVELWSPGSPLFPNPESADTVPSEATLRSIRQLLP